MSLISICFFSVLLCISSQLFSQESNIFPLPERTYTAEYYFNRGRANIANGEFDRAIEDFTQVILLDQTNALAFAWRGTIYMDLGEYDRAIEDYTQAALFDPDEGAYLFVLGAVYSRQGNIVLAKELFSQAILLRPDNADMYMIRGVVYSILGDYESALDDFNQAILLDPDNAVLYGRRGLAYTFLGEYELAIADLTKAILLDPDDGSNYTQRGRLYNNTANYEEALVDFFHAIELDPHDYLAYYNRGLSYSAKDEHDLAVKDFEEALNVAEMSSNLNDIFTVTGYFLENVYSENPYLNMDNAPLMHGFINLVMDGISRSINRAEQVRSSLGVRGSAIMAQALYFYYMGVDLEAHFGSLEKVFEYSESLRSRGFLDQMGTEAALRLPGISQEERERIQDITRQIENRQNVLNAFSLRPPQTPEEQSNIVNAGQELSLLEAELAALDADINNRIPNYAELRNPRPANLSQAWEWLANDTAVLIYTLWDDSIEFDPIGYWSFSRPAINSYCLILTKDGLVPVLLDPEFDYITPINHLRTNIRYQFDLSEMESDRNALYKQLIEPVLPHIPVHIQNIIIVPDGTLGHLPFDVLRKNINSPDFGETYRLSFSPSVSISMLSERAEPENLPIIAFGGAWYEYDRNNISTGSSVRRGIVFDTASNYISWDDLPGTEAEVRMLQQLVPSADNITVVLGSYVSEEYIKALSASGKLAEYPILHIAAHGYFSEDDPERTGIVLSEVSGLLDNDEDGYLTIPEIAVFDLNARMILLSACETGLGILRRGDGMVGMARAFMIAGAENVGVSLWKIDDQVTVEFMTRLYTKVLYEGKSFKDAYYLVKNEFRHDEELGHPFYWAAFTMYE